MPTKHGISTQRGKEHSNSLERLLEHIPKAQPFLQGGTLSSVNLPLLKPPHKHSVHNPTLQARNSDLSSSGNHKHRQLAKTLGQDQRSDLPSALRGPNDTRVDQENKGITKHLYHAKAN